MYDVTMTSHISNIYCKIQDYSKKIFFFFKIVISNIVGLHQSRSP